jgi:hypothetical protein
MQVQLKRQQQLLDKLDLTPQGRGDWFDELRYSAGEPVAT